MGVLLLPVLAGVVLLAIKMIGSLQKTLAERRLNRAKVDATTLLELGEIPEEWVRKLRTFAQREKLPQRFVEITPWRVLAKPYLEKQLRGLKRALVSQPAGNLRIDTAVEADEERTQAIDELIQRWEAWSLDQILNQYNVEIQP